MSEDRQQHNNPSFRVWLCGALRVERRTGTAYEAVRTVEWGGSSYPRLLLKALVCCPGRQARREALMELLWPDGEPEQAGQNLNTATTKLRNVLRPTKEQESLLLTENDASIYRLPGQEQLWVDADEALAALKEVERLGRTSPEAIPLLEQATERLNHGTFLDGEEGIWASGKRATIERVRYRARLWLAEAYEQQGMPGQAEMVMSLLLEEDPTDEDALSRLLLLLHRQGMTQKALRLYEQACQVFAEEGLELTEATKKLADRLQERHCYAPTASLSSYGIVPLLGHAHSEQATLSTFTEVLSQGIVLAVKALKQEETQTSPMIGGYWSSRKVPSDILEYKRNIRLALHLHRTSTAQGLLQEVNTDIQNLEQLEQQAKGHDLYCVKELLIGNLLLAAKIVKDQGQYPQAYGHVNKAVQTAKSLEDGDLIATTKYMRGCVKLEWAQFGICRQGILQLNEAKVRDALHDFQDILNMAYVQRTLLHPQLHGFTYLQTGRAYSLLHDEWDGSPAKHPLTLIDQAESMVDCASIEDAYTRLILTGTLSGLHWGAYHLNKTEMFIALGLPDQALAQLNCLRQLTERTYQQDEMRNQAWNNLVMAEVFMGIEAYADVANMLKDTLHTCRSINSLQNAATIRDIYHRLAMSSYGTSSDVEEIDSILKGWDETA